ncbi:MAG TPA: BatD family protein [Candidatus Binatia bacterium]
MVIRSTSCRRALAALAAVAIVASAGVASAAVHASLDRDVVHEDDTLRLTLSGDAQGEPDLTPLARDFEILGTQQSHSVSIVNGRVDAKRELEVLLRPKRSGELEIPALRVGDESTTPLTVSVLDAAAAPGASRGTTGAGRGATSAGRGAAGTASNAASVTDRHDAPDLFVEATVDRDDPFVQGEVRYTVRVFDGVGIREGALTEPAADGVRVEPRGDTRTYEEIVDGRRYVVHEREYALYPQESGTVTIPPVVLQARVRDPQRGAARSPFDDAFDDAFGGFPGDDVLAEMLARMRSRSFFGSSLIDRMMNPGREVRVRSNPVELSVQARPADAGQGWFLPARSVTLEESWRPAQPTFRVGETVRRTILLRAEGASAAQLPPLEVTTPDGIRQYAAGTPRTTSGSDVAESVHTFELVPTRAGTFTLPAVEVEWWDVEAKVARTATLPAQTIEVLPAPGTQHADAGSAAAPAAKGAASVAAPASEVATGAASGVPSSVKDAVATGDDTLPSELTALATHPAVLAAGAVAVLLLLLAATWRLARRTPAADAATASGASPAASHVAPRALVDALRQACASGDARAARDALVAWGRAEWPHAAPATAREVARRLGHAGLKRAVERLDDALYAPRGAAFDGDALWREFRTARGRRARDAHDDAATPLPPLYPTSSACIS